MGSATSRNPPGHRHIVRLCGPGESVIVAAGLSETGANRVAEAINEFLGRVFGRPTPDQFFRGNQGLTRASSRQRAASTLPPEKGLK